MMVFLESVLIKLTIPCILRHPAQLTSSFLSDLRTVANEYANNDPQAAAQWAEQFVGTKQNSRLFGEIVREWGNQEAVSAWVESLEPSQG